MVLRGSAELARSYLGDHSRDIFIRWEAFPGFQIPLNAIESRDTSAIKHGNRCLFSARTRHEFKGFLFARIVLISYGRVFCLGAEAPRLFFRFE